MKAKRPLLHPKMATHRRNRLSGRILVPEFGTLVGSRRSRRLASEVGRRDSVSSAREGKLYQEAQDARCTQPMQRQTHFNVNGCENRLFYFKKREEDLDHCAGSIDIMEWVFLG